MALFFLAMFKGFSFFEGGGGGGQLGTILYLWPVVKYTKKLLAIAAEMH